MRHCAIELPRQVLADAQRLAEQSGVSLHQFLTTLVAERVGELKATARIRSRAERTNPAAALTLLAHVPERTPFAGDELL